MDPLLEIDDVTFGYGSQPVLENICLHLHPGQFAALVGPSGAGKTTLLKLILGTLQPSQGEICFRGKSLKNGTSPRIGYVPQRESVDWNFPVTVEQAVWMGQVRNKNPWPWIKSDEQKQVRGMLERLGIPDLAGRHIRDLSGGQQQRVFLARALISRPDLLVLDEPTVGLDIQTAEMILVLLAELNRQGITLLMTTHDLNAAAAHLPWVICLNRQVVAEGTPEDVFNEKVLSETYRGEMLVIRHD
ncbi:MAG TPA: metal ABC transporter ATP-binding protein, partial [Anaerolineales bacterium]|nr:metal ABC transporter ATP-binding protein [Anaerolineales bacterium]